MKKKFYLNLSLIIFLDVVTALTARLAYEIDEWWPVVISVLAICFAAPIFMKLLKEEVTAVVSILWIGGGVLAVAITSFFVFDETLSTQQILGMLLMAVGLVLTQLHPHPQNK
ncbi:MAG: SMR family transporter [Patescibacteria group bacterium]